LNPSSGNLEVFLKARLVGVNARYGPSVCEVQNYRFPVAVIFHSFTCCLQKFGIEGLGFAEEKEFFWSVCGVGEVLDDVNGLVVIF
jgi:hypothetical protein